MGIDGDLKALDGYTQQYRDVNLVIEASFPGMSGDEVKILCEIQLTLSPIAILKKSEQKIYSLMRMENPAELREQYVFSRKSEEDESTVLTHQSQYSDVAPPGGPLNTKKKAIAAAGLMADSDEAPLLGVTGKY